ncbi:MULTISPECIES: hypothetical protein [Paraburkholderia]|uniref:hypothetical protein n=1 Tax=Paraburkholderia aspalathi TaxID=1324617 RepID=UPI0038BD7285
MTNKKPEFEFWTVNGSTDFAFMPPGLVSMAPSTSVPIRLQHGTGEWGEVHINRNHGSWLMQQGTTAAEMVHKKLSQPGSIFTTEEESKLKVNITLSPTALLVLRFIPWQQPFFTVVTVYFKSAGRLDGQYLGTYPGTGGPQTPGQAVVFTPPATPSHPQVTYRKRRILDKAA